MADQVEAKAVIKVNADTKQAVQEIYKLQKAQQAVTEETKKTKASFKDTVESISNGFAKFNLAAGGVSTAFQMIGKGLDAAFTEARLEAQEKLLAPGLVNRLQVAVDGLIPRTATLGIAVKAMTGDFALTESQMGKVLRASIALEQKGYGPAVEIAEKLNDALVNGVNRLDDFGIDLDKTDDRLGDVNRAMSSFDQIIRETPVDERTASLKRLQNGLQAVAEAMNTVVAAAANGVAWLMETGGDIGVFFGSDISEIHGGRNVTRAQNEAYFRERNARERAQREARAAEAGLLRSEDDSEYAAQFGVGAFGTTPFNEAYEYGGWDYRKDRGGPYSAPGSDVGERTVYGQDSVTSLGLGLAGAQGMGPEGLQSGISVEGGFGQGSLFLRDPDALADWVQKSQPALSFMDDLANTAGGASAAMGLLEGAFGAAVTAAVEGGDGIASAFAKAAAGGLKAMAIEHAIRALSEGAFALSSLAFGDARGAALHGIAAGKHAAVAAAAGIGAAALGSMTGSSGGGGGGSGAVAGGSAGSYSTGASGEANAGQINIYLGDGFIGSPQQVGDEITKAVRKANQRGARGGNSYTTSFD